MAASAVAERQDDFAFYLGEEVNVGALQGSVVGVAFFSDKNDEFQISYIDDDGTPTRRWFPRLDISHTKKH